MVVNALTVDVEDYFQVSAFAGVVSRDSWAAQESRVVQNTERLLRAFEDAGTRATFFVLGWVAERYPALIKRIHAAGHELASHSYDHALVYDRTPEDFREDLRRARQAIGDATGVRVDGYRAPSFSITNRSLWALDVLVAEGYRFDSSIYPIRHDRYGIPTWDRFVTTVACPNGKIEELPGSTIRAGGVNLPFGGGGYFRLLPYWWTRRGMTQLNDKEAQPCIFYIHPWEVDPDQPRIRGSASSRFRHYYNLDQTEPRLRRLLRQHSFDTVSAVLQNRDRSKSQPIG